MFCSPLSNLALLSEKYGERSAFSNDSITQTTSSFSHLANSAFQKKSFNYYDKNSIRNLTSQNNENNQSASVISLVSIPSQVQNTPTTNSAITDLSLSPSSFPEILYSSSDSSNKLTDSNQNLETSKLPKILSQEDFSSLDKRLSHEFIFNTSFDLYTKEDTINNNTNQTGPQEDYVKCEYCHMMVNSHSEVYLMVGSRFYHPDCLECSVCSQNLQWDESCFFHESNIYCRQHYYLISTCSYCHLKFRETDMILRLPSHATFHSTCFKCTLCGDQLQQGNKFCLLNNDIYCSKHSDLVAETINDCASIISAKESLKSKKSEDATSKKTKNKKLTKQNNPRSLNTNNDKENKIIWPEIYHDTSSENLVNSFEATSEILDQEHNLKKIPTGEPDIIDSSCQDKNFISIDSSEGYFIQSTSTKDSVDSPGMDDNMTSSRDDLRDLFTDTVNHGSRRKRIRTSFKHQQLRIMKSYFEFNHNPDAKDLKQLSQRTGLPKRVLQVWFQNARAKYRRSLNGTGLSLISDADMGSQHSINSPNISFCESNLKGDLSSQENESNELF